MGPPAMKIYVCVNILLVATVFASFKSMATATTSQRNKSTAILIRVDQAGHGDFKKIQDAIDSVPSKNPKQVVIWVKPGIYREKIVVPADKPFITISGTAPSTTIITWGDGGDILTSPTFTVFASDFVARYLTIQNTYGSAGKAVALRVSADRAAFYGCRIMSYQDTILDDHGSHYYRNCYIEGATDFICGNAASLFERCHLHSVSKKNGSITAQRRTSPSENTGFTFLGCKITGIGSAELGRPWGAYSRVIYALTYMSSVIEPQGWDDWGERTTHYTTFYGEYKNYGPGAEISKRVKWSYKLTDNQAAPFLTKNMIGGRDWLRSIPKTFKRRPTTIAGKADGNN